MRNTSSTALVPGWYVEFQAALLRQAPRPGEIDQLTAEGWNSNQKGLKKNLADCLLPPPVAEEKSNLLEFVSTVVIPATTSKFVAKDRFVTNIKSNTPVKINYLGDNFIKWFLSGKGKTEESISEHALRYAKMSNSLADGSIIAQLGGEEKSETMLSDIFSLMEKQKNGEDGALLTNISNSRTNIFYIKDHAGVLRAVNVGRNDFGWYVNANFVEYPNWWGVGHQVFSRNSVLESSEPSTPA